MLSWKNKILFLINFCVTFCLLAGLLTPYIHPGDFIYLSYLALGIHFLLFTSVVLLIYWIFRWIRKGILLNVIILLICYGPVSKTISFKKNLPENPHQAIKVLSYNVMNMDLYRWSSGEIVKEKIIKLIDSLCADIICLQEFYQGDDVNNDNIKRILSLTGNKYHFFHPFVSRPKRGGHFGNVIFSRFPIIRTGVIPFPGKTSNGGIFVDLLLTVKDTIRVYSLHMESFHIPQQDFSNLENPGKDEKESVKSAKKIRRKLSIAFIKREAQAMVVRKSLDKCHYPVMVAGDFNDTPYSYSYHKIRGELSDAFTTSGKWWSATVYKPMPLWRIDYLLYSKRFNVFGYETIDRKISDHKPVYAWFEIP